jgi:N-acetylglucosaminyldiphosphoundecaprenol N-acetyl-beta-D-mannosaminyltransferase
MISRLVGTQDHLLTLGVQFTMLDFTRGGGTAPEHNGRACAKRELSASENCILGIPFSLIDYRRVYEAIVTWRENQDRQFVTLTPPHTVLMCQQDVALREATKHAGLTLPDGIGIVLAARLLRYPDSGRVSGPTLMLRLCDWGRAEGLRHFFYGGAPGVCGGMAMNLMREYPGLSVAGAHCPPFREPTLAEDKEIVELINRAKPDIVWVGLGSPKQEKWMAEHVGRIEAAALIGVGAAFDFHSGRVRWAPGWMRRAGLEWVYRLAQEPRRMWQRDMNGVVFLAKVVRQCLRSRGGQQTDIPLEG